MISLSAILCSEKCRRSSNMTGVLSITLSSGSHVSWLPFWYPCYLTSTSNCFLRLRTSQIKWTRWWLASKWAARSFNPWNACSPGCVTGYKIIRCGWFTWRRWFKMSSTTNMRLDLVCTIFIGVRHYDCSLWCALLWVRITTLFSTWTLMGSMLVF